MKLTDLAITFMIFFICLVVVVHIKADRLHGELINQVMYNNVMDGIVEDTLQAGYKSVDKAGNPVVSLQELKRCFQAECGLYGGQWDQFLFYIEKDGFYCCESYNDFQWSRKTEFPEGEEMLHEDKVLYFIDFIQEQYGIKVTLPINDGESWVNTIKEYSLLAVSYDTDTDICCFSGALIH